MDSRQYHNSTSSENRLNTPNRHFNTPSPVVFPSASPTPKLYSTPTKKLPEVKPWQEIGIESVPQNSANIIYHHDDTTIIHNGGGADYHQHQNYNYNHYNSREKTSNYSDTRTISPLSMMLDSDTLLDDEDISSYRFSEEDYLSSIISSRPPSSISASPLRRRPVSFSSPSPQQQLHQLDEEEANDDKLIVGSPFAPVPNDDPIIERPRRFSLGSPIPSDNNAGAIANNSSSKLGSFGKNFMSRMKKAASGKPSLFK